ncbi:hypothetical protein Tco_1151044 [Tanacetum coccineum]
MSFTSLVRGRSNKSHGKAGPHVKEHFIYTKSTIRSWETRKWSAEDDKRRSKDLSQAMREKTTDQKDLSKSRKKTLLEDRIRDIDYRLINKQRDGHVPSLNFQLVCLGWKGELYQMDRHAFYINWSYKVGKVSTIPNDSAITGGFYPGQYTS